MKKTTIGTWMLFLVLSATFIFSTSNAWAWGSSRSYSSSYTSSSSGSSWGTSGTSRDGSTSWSSWSYSDNGSATSETLCRKCHGDLKRFPGLKYENPDKHHLLINKVMPSNSVAPYDTPGNLYECLTCHAVEKGSNGFVMTVTRDCLKCHPINTVTGRPWRSNNVHHNTRIYNCNTCHSVIGY